MFVWIKKNKYTIYLKNTEYIIYANKTNDATWSHFYRVYKCNQYINSFHILDCAKTYIEHNIMYPAPKE